MTVVRGWPGVGKTTLAAMAAHDEDIKRAFPDGVLWVTLGQKPVIKAELAVWGTALELYSVRNARTEFEAKARLSGHLSESRMLLIVDDLWEPNHLQWFQVGGTNCATIVTTRDYGIARKVSPAQKDIYLLKVLSDSAALELLRSVAGEVLFNENPEACRHLVRDLGNLPLAVRVAGALLADEADLGSDILSFVDDLRREARILEAEAPSDIPDLLGRKTLKILALLQKSTERLSPRQIQRFQATGAFAPEPATFESDSLAAVWGDNPDDTQDSLRTLIKRGLLEPDGTGRFRTHALLTMLARRMLGDVPEIYYRHFHYYAALVAQSQSQIKGPEQSLWLDRINQEHLQVLHALEEAQKRGEIESALLLSGSLFRFWYVHGLTEEGRDRFASLLNIPGTRDYPAACADALHGYGSLLWATGHEDSAEVALQECLSIRRQLRDYRGMGNVLNNLGLLRETRRDYTGASDMYEDSVLQLLASGSRSSTSAPLGNLARIAIFQYDTDRARTFNAQSFEIRSEEGNKRGLADCEQVKGDIFFLEGDYPNTKITYRNSLLLFAALGNKLGVTQILERMATVAAREQRLDRAATLLGAAQKFRSDIGSPLPASERAHYEERTFPLFHSRLEEAYNIEWTLGYTMSEAEAVHYAKEGPADFHKHS